MNEGEFYLVCFECVQEIVEQQGCFGYEQYVVMGFVFWCNEVELVMDFDEVGYCEIYGVSVLYDWWVSFFLMSELFVFVGLEFGGILVDFVCFVKLVFDVQQRCWEEDDVFIVLSEDSLSQLLWFIYGLVFYGEVMWNVFDLIGQVYEQYCGFLIKVVFGWYVFYLNVFMQQFVGVVVQFEYLCYGFFVGFFESGEVNEVLSLNMNVVVFEFIFYCKCGN